jgi:hypothetical protein
MTNPSDHSVAEACRNVRHAYRDALIDALVLCGRPAQHGTIVDSGLPPDEDQRLTLTHARCLTAELQAARPMARSLTMGSGPRGAHVLGTAVATHAALHAAADPDGTLERTVTDAGLAQRLVDQHGTLLHAGRTLTDREWHGIFCAALRAGASPQPGTGLPNLHARERALNHAVAHQLLRADTPAMATAA